jgi:hypothetical protein
MQGGDESNSNTNMNTYNNGGNYNYVKNYNRGGYKKKVKKIFYPKNFLEFCSQKSKSTI